MLNFGGANDFYASKSTSFSPFILPVTGWSIAVGYRESNPATGGHGIAVALSTVSASTVGLAAGNIHLWKASDYNSTPLDDASVVANRWSFATTGWGNHPDAGGSSADLFAAGPVVRDGQMRLLVVTFDGAMLRYWGGVRGGVVALLDSVTVTGATDINVNQLFFGARSDANANRDWEEDLAQPFMYAGVLTEAQMNSFCAGNTLWNAVAGVNASLIRFYVPAESATVALAATLDDVSVNDNQLTVVGGALTYSGVDFVSAVAYDPPVVTRQPSFDVDVAGTVSTLTGGTAQAFGLTAKGDPEFNAGGNFFERLAYRLTISQARTFAPAWDATGWRQANWPINAIDASKNNAGHYQAVGAPLEAWTPCTIASGAGTALVTASPIALAAGSYDFAWVPVFTYARIEEYLQSLVGNPYVAKPVVSLFPAANDYTKFRYHDFPDFVSQDGIQVGSTFSYGCVITDPTQMPLDGNQKRNILCDWVHAGEDPGLWNMYFFIKYLLGGSPTAQMLRRNFKFFFAWQNTAGMFGGNARGCCDPADDGDDPNRAAPTGITQAGVFTYVAAPQDQIPSLDAMYAAVRDEFGLIDIGGNNWRINGEGVLAWHGSYFNTNYPSDFSSNLAAPMIDYAAQVRTQWAALGGAGTLNNDGDATSIAAPGRDGHFGRFVMKGTLYHVQEAGYNTRDFLIEAARIAEANAKTLEVMFNAGAYPAAAAGVGTIAVGGIAAGRIYQRAAGQGSTTIPVGYIYTGAPASIEARVETVSTGAAVAGLDWQVVVAAPVGGAGSVNISVPQGGDYVVRLRFSNAPAVAAVSPAFAVGVLMVAYGGTNALALDTVSASPEAAAAGTRMFKAGAWSAATGNGAARLLNELRQLTGLPCGLIVEGVADASSTQLVPGGAGYIALQARLAATGNNVELLLLCAGEREPAVTEVDYKSRLTAIYDGVRTITGRSQSQLRCLIAQMGRDPAGSMSAAAYADIARWQREWGLSVPGVVYSHDMLDLAVQAGGYTLTAAAAAQHGERAAEAAAYALGISAARPLGPSISAVYRTGAVVTVALQHVGGTGLQDLVGSETGFEVSADNFATTLPISSVAIVQPNQVIITLTSAPPAPVHVRYAYGRNYDASQLVYDNAA